ncbi:hypothetical protein Tco_0391137, partial [Tanacetum coccineum]
MCTCLKNMEGYKLNDLKLKEFNSIQEIFDRAFKRVNTFKDFRTELVEGKAKRAGIELAQEITMKQKEEDDKETTEIKKLMEIIPGEEEVAIDAIPLAVKSPNSAHMVAASKVPMLKPSEYEIWRMRIEQYIQMINYALWEVIENGATLPKTTTVEGVVT